MDNLNCTPGMGVQGNGQVDLSKVSAVPRLRGSNAELYEVKIFDGSDPFPGKLLKIISKEEIIKRDRAKKNNKLVLI